MKALERWASDVSKPLAMPAQASAHIIALYGDKPARIVSGNMTPALQPSRSG